MCAGNCYRKPEEAFSGTVSRIKGRLRNKRESKRVERTVRRLWDKRRAGTYKIKRAAACGRGGQQAGRNAPVY